jgi:hypothetical protein
MPNSSFYVDGEQYGTAVVTSNDVTPSADPSQAPSSFYPGGDSTLIISGIATRPHGGWPPVGRNECRRPIVSKAEPL